MFQVSSKKQMFQVSSFAFYVYDITLMHNHEQTAGHSKCFVHVIIMNRLQVFRAAQRREPSLDYRDDERYGLGSFVYCCGGTQQNLTCS